MNDLMDIWILFCCAETCRPIWFGLTQLVLGSRWTRNEPVASSLFASTSLPKVTVAFLLEFFSNTSTHSMVRISNSIMHRFLISLRYFSFMLALGAGKRDGGGERWPRSTFASRARNDGRGEDVVAREWMGRSEICKPQTLKFLVVKSPLLHLYMNWRIISTYMHYMYNALVQTCMLQFE